jgi:hypothetical protein
LGPSRSKVPTFIYFYSNSNHLDESDTKEKRTDDIPSWDVEFLKVDQGTLFELILVNLRNKTEHL